MNIRSLVDAGVITQQEADTAVRIEIRISASNGSCTTYYADGHCVYRSFEVHA